MGHPSQCQAGLGLAFACRAREPGAGCVPHGSRAPRRRAYIRAGRSRRVRMPPASPRGSRGAAHWAIRTRRCPWHNLPSERPGARDHNHLSGRCPDSERRVDSLLQNAHDISDLFAATWAGAQPADNNPLSGIRKCEPDLEPVTHAGQLSTGGAARPARFRCDRADGLPAGSPARHRVVVLSCCAMMASHLLTLTADRPPAPASTASARRDSVSVTRQLPHLMHRASGSSPRSAWP